MGFMDVKALRDFYLNINSYLLYSFIRSHTSIYLLNSITNNARNIDVYVRFSAGQTILAETVLVCYETDQFLSKQ